MLLLSPALWGEVTHQILLVVNDADPSSKQVAGYYRDRREIPTHDICTLNTTPAEEITWDIYLKEIEDPIAACLKNGHLTETVLYIVTTMGVPLKITGPGSGMTAEYASVDSELTLLYSKMKGFAHGRAGPIPNPFFGNRDAPFRHPSFPIYLVTRLAAFDVADAQQMINRSLQAKNTGKFIIDAQSTAGGDGNAWLRNAALVLPRSRVVLDVDPMVLYQQNNVIAYAGWGSNDGQRKGRYLGYQWLPGAIVDEFVSTNARTFHRPGEDWTIGSGKDFMGSQQDLLADYLHEGATGGAGNVYEPYLQGCARPDYVLPAYFDGRNLAESFYMGLPYLSWQGVVIGDPLTTLGKP